MLGVRDEESGLASKTSLAISDRVRIRVRGGDRGVDIVAKTNKEVASSARRLHVFFEAFEVLCRDSFFLKGVSVSVFKNLKIFVQCNLTNIIAVAVAVEPTQLNLNQYHVRREAIEQG